MFTIEDERVGSRMVKSTWPFLVEDGWEWLSWMVMEEDGDDDDDGDDDEGDGDDDGDGDGDGDNDGGGDEGCDDGWFEIEPHRT